MLHIFVDADACPVKDEVYRVAQRCGLAVTLVANSWMRVPKDALIHLEIVPGGFDAADDWIAEHAGPDDIVISADIPLAGRCLAKGACVLGSTGQAVYRRQYRLCAGNAGIALRASRPGGNRRRAAALQQARPLSISAGARQNDTGHPQKAGIYVAYVARPFVVSPGLDEVSSHVLKAALRQAQGERIQFSFSQFFYEGYCV